MAFGRDSLNSTTIYAASVFIAASFDGNHTYGYPTRLPFAVRMSLGRMNCCGNYGRATALPVLFIFFWRPRLVDEGLAGVVNDGEVRCPPLTAGYLRAVVLQEILGSFEDSRLFRRTAA